MTGKEAYRRPQPTLDAPVTASNHQARQRVAPASLTGFRLKTARGALITSSLPMLQNLIKRSSDSYAEEFLVQWGRFGSLVEIAKVGLGGKGDEEGLREVTGFVCQVAHLYPSITHTLPSLLSNLLLSSAPAASASAATAAPIKSAQGATATVGVNGGGVQLSPEVRKTMMQGLVLLRRRDVITGVDLLKTLFPLLSMTTSPNLRSFILKTILSDIKTANQKAKNHKLNRLVQSLLFGMISRGIDAEAERLGTGVKASRRGDVKIVGAREAMWAVKIAAELWRKNVWRDAKTVSIVAMACFHPDTKVQSAAIHFFLIIPGDGDKEEEDSDEEDNAGPDIKTVKHVLEINKKRKGSERKAKKDIKSANVKRRLKEIAAKEPSVNFSALQLLNDPQTFGEKLYQSLSKYDRAYTLDHKILIMSLFGRVCGSHKLTVLSFYSYIIKYLTHHQLQITAILVCLAQSVHDLTPPDELTPVIKKIASEFVHSGVAAEVIAAGLNAIREICRRQPWCMERELLEDLVDYKMSKDKGVMVASRGLLQLFREVNPGMLKRRERGKVASLKAVGGGGSGPMAYGEERDNVDGIEGLDLLAKHLSEKSSALAREKTEAEEWAEWEVESAHGSDSDSENEWKDVVSDSDSDINLSDSEDDSDAEPGEKVEVVGADGKVVLIEGKKKRASTNKRERKRRKIEKSRLESKAEEARLVDEGAEGTPVLGKKKKNVNFVGLEDDSGDSYGEDEDDVEPVVELSVVDVDAEEVDGEGEGVPKAKKEIDPQEQDEMSLSRATKVLEGTTWADLATTKILTPADFAKINELRTAAAEEETKNGGGSAARRKLAALTSARKANMGHTEEFLTEGEIIGVQKKAKNTYEERLAMIAEGREGREKFGSLRGKKLAEKEHSTTNEEKRKGKAFAMVAASRGVRKKNTSSLQQKSKALRSHIDRIKRGGRRGNNG